MEPRRFLEYEGPAVSRYVFGPVPSRRLGRSLGVDLVPFKTCTYDCIYCQLGRTTSKTIERKEWVPLEAVLDELDRRLASRPDYITLSGSGEPTLFSRLDEVIAAIKQRTQIPVAVLTNGSLLWMGEVQRQLLDADLVIPSLDAGGAEVYRLVNRPHETISFDRMLSGLVDFRQRFHGKFWLEVFLVGAYTTLSDELAGIRRCVDLIKPDRVQLNTVTRPPAEGFALPVHEDRLRAIASTFAPPAEVIGDYQQGGDVPDITAGREEILALIERRPCSVVDIADGLGLHPHEVAKHLESLAADELVATTWNAGKPYYESVKKSSAQRDLLG
jgi:wyosine [tRNA(Phe)-imidazoG37] synthetase (radical SAM superfamily)